MGIACFQVTLGVDTPGQSDQMQLPNWEGLQLCGIPIIAIDGHNMIYTDLDVSVNIRCAIPLHAKHRLRRCTAVTCCEFAKGSTM